MSSSPQSIAEVQYLMQMTTKMYLEDSARTKERQQTHSQRLLNIIFVCEKIQKKEVAMCPFSICCVVISCVQVLSMLNMLSI